MSMTLIERIDIGSGGAASIDFSSIPQTYTDLQLIFSPRASNNNTGYARLSFFLKPNGTTSGSTSRLITGNGSFGASSQSYSAGSVGWITANDATANVFSSATIYIPNYATSVNKTASIEIITENNNAGEMSTVFSGYISGNSSPITSLSFSLESGNFAQYSSASLYGINRQSAFGKPKAIGGNITFANGHWYHTFTGSNTFFAKSDLTCDALVIAGGGGGGDVGGGGGAGGIQLLSGIKLLAGNNSVFVGSGGAASVNGASGFMSAINSFTQSVGGGGGGGYQAAGSSGGSGGGGGSFNGSAGGAGTSGQGNSGGSGTANSLSANRGAGGGGGAGTSGNGGSTSGTGGSGGTGLNIYSTWASATSTGVSGYYAAGGGGEGYYTGGAGGTGGGGNGGTNTTAAVAGTANTGSGGGGSVFYSGNGGSGLVIIRYPAD